MIRHSILVVGALLAAQPILAAGIGGNVVSNQTEVVPVPAMGVPLGGGALWPHTIRFDGAGVAWFTIAISNQVGRFDPKTLAVQEFDPPASGPRRLRFDAVGTLWIPAFGDGALVRLDTRTMKYTTYDMPRLSPDEERFITYPLPNVIEGDMDTVGCLDLGE